VLAFDTTICLVERIESRGVGEQTLNALRTWIAGQVTQSSAAWPSGAGGELRGFGLRFERALAAGIAADIGLPADALAPSSPPPHW
jgi:hypothetical protein